MSDNKQMLDYIFKGAEMGHDSITQLMRETDDSEFRNKLDSQREEYHRIMEQAEELSIKHGDGTPKGIGVMQRMSSEAMTTMKTLTDNSTSKLAEMMIQGSTMGVTKMSRYISEYAGMDSEVSQLAHKLLRTEESNIEQMKQYL